MNRVAAAVGGTARSVHITTDLGGMVKAVASGEGRILSVTINPDVVDPEDVDLLQDMVLAAVNDALTQIAEESARRMDAVTGGMKIPGMR